MHYPNERRKSTERRQADAGPPKGCAERRRGEERRVLRIVEVEIPTEAWESYFAARMNAAGEAVPSPCSDNCAS